MNYVIIGFIIYAILIYLISYFNKTKDIAKLGYLGKRKFKVFGLATSIAASWIGINTLIILAAFISGFGIWPIIALCLPLIVLAILPYILTRYQSTFTRNKFTTFFDFIRFRSNKKIAIFFALASIIFSFINLVNGIIAGANILSLTGGVGLTFAIFIVSVFILIYLLIGGFKSVIATDKIQYLAIILILVLAVIGINFIDLSNINFSEILFKKTTIIPIIFFLVYGLLATIPENAFWQRIYATDDRRTLRKSMLWGAILTIIPLVLLTLIAVIGLSSGINDPSMAIITFFQSSLGGALEILSIIFILSIMMSSIDTLLFSSSTIVLNDFIKNKPNVSKQRLTFVIITILAIVMAIFSPNILNNAILGIGLFFMIAIPSVYLVFFRKINRLTLYFTVSGSILGLIYSIIINQLGMELTLYIVGVGLAGLIIGKVIEMFTKKKL